MKTLNEIRKTYLDHMKNHVEYPHVVISSSALVPENDPTTLFTGSGMQPMLPYLLGQPHPLGKRIADSQKCFRSQDIEEVGDNRHTTFFEMLGNWSLGDYFKEEQIDIMWDFLINKLQLDPNRLYISIYEGNEKLNIQKDVVAENAWQEKFKSVGVSIENRVFAYPDKKNWWSRSGVPENMPVGEPGGPDTEMFYDFEHDKENVIHASSEWSSEACHVNCDCGRYVEIGNNVFMQYKKTEDGVEELIQKNVDFGGGLERMTAAINDDSDVFNLDAFEGAKSIIKNISDQNYEGENVYAYRVVLDHLRAATFLIGDGVYPGNKDQQYFVRRLIRRAVRFAKKLNINNNFTREVSKTFIDYYKNEYTNLSEKETDILKIMEDEEVKFRKTLESGLKILEAKTFEINPVTPQVNLFESFTVQDFEMLERRDFIDGKWLFDLNQNYGFPFELAIEVLKEKDLIHGDNHLMFLKNNFDIEKNKHSEASRTASAGKFKGGLGGDGEIETKYHTATHMLHEALRQVLGEHVSQKGSNITSERLRFDFSHDNKMTDEEKKKVEVIVNAEIKANLKVTREEVSYDKAREMGAIGVFDNKYGEMVSVYHVGDFSLEFCGGPHVEHTGDMGVFKILKEEAVSAGIRRIKAVLE